MAHMRVAFPLAIAALILLPVSASSQGPGITTINCQGASSTIVIGINDTGRAVGYYRTATGGIHGFITDNRGACEPLPGLPDGYMPFGLNDSEHIVGIHIGTTGEQRGFVYRRGQVTDIFFPGGPTDTLTLGINNRSQVVGAYDRGPSASEPPICGPDCPFMWEDGTYIPLTLPIDEANDSVAAIGINVRGDIVGNWNDNSGIEQGYLWPRAGVPITFGFPLAHTNFPTSINARGEIVGFFFATADLDDPEMEGALFGPCRGFFRDRDGNLTELKVPGASYTCTLGLNAAGEISGIWTTETGVNYADFVWHGFIAKKEALQP